MSEQAASDLSFESRRKVRSSQGHPKAAWTMSKKTYEVTRSTSGQVGVLIHHETEAVRNSTLLKHCNLHSPDGFETGYGGSGPSDLAASILADHFSVDPKLVEGTYRSSLSQPRQIGKTIAMKVITLHQPFKWAFIAGQKLVPGQSYNITTEQINRWLESQVE